MNILYLSHYFPPEGNAPALRVHRFAREWVRAGHRVTVITGIPNVPNGIPYPGYANRWYQEEAVDGIRVVRVWTYLAPNKGTLRRIANYLSFMLRAIPAGLAIERSDIIIATSPQFFCAWAGRIIAWLRHVPFVLEIRDLWPASIEAVGAIRSGLILSLLKKLEAWLYAACPRIVTVGEGYKSDLVRAGVDAARIDVIPNGVEITEARASTPVNPRERYSIPAEDFLCAYIGTIGMAAGLEVVLEAAQSLQRNAITGITFLLVGDGAARSSLEQRIRDERIPNVHFCGRIPHEETGTCLDAADACLVHLIPSPVFESVLPTKLLEATAAAKPVILGVAGFAADLVRTAGCGICITPGNAGELVSAIQTLRDNPDLRRTLGNAGRQNVASLHAIPTLAARYLALLQDVVERNRPPTKSAASRNGRQP